MLLISSVTSEDDGSGWILEWSESAFFDDTSEGIEGQAGEERGEPGLPREFESWPKYGLDFPQEGPGADDLIVYTNIEKPTGASFYKPGIVFFLPSANDFLGYCNGTRVERGELSGVGECVSNYFNPSLPNPLIIVESISGQELENKINSLYPLRDFKTPTDYFELLNPITLADFLGDIIFSLINIPLVLGYSIIQLLSSLVRYVLVFFVRFMLVYLVYVSLGFQAILIVLDRNNPTILEHPDKVKLTVVVMVAASIITLGGGLW